MEQVWPDRRGEEGRKKERGPHRGRLRERIRHATRRSSGFLQREANLNASSLSSSIGVATAVPPTVRQPELPDTPASPRPMARSSTSGWSLDGNIAFRDVITQQRKQLPSRLTLDDRRLTEYRGVFEAVKETIREQAARQEGPSRVGSLRDACLAVLAEELLFGHLKAEKKGDAPASTARSDSSMAGAEAERSISMEDNALSVLWDPESGRPRLPDPLCAGLLERILAFLPFDDATLPFGLFLAFTRVCMRSDVVFRRLAGARRRDLVVYPGLVLSDSLELAQLASVGVPRQDRTWGSFPQFSCLTILDLSFFATWKDEDMHSLKHSVGTTLAWLALEGTQVTDTGVGHLCRACHHEAAEGTEEEEGGPSGESAAERTRRLGPRERFCRLQAITLKGLKGITDKGIARVASLPSIRLIGQSPTNPKVSDASSPCFCSQTSEGRLAPRQPNGSSRPTSTRLPAWRPSAPLPHSLSSPPPPKWTVASSLRPTPSRIG